MNTRTHALLLTFVCTLAASAAVCTFAASAALAEPVTAPVPAAVSLVEVNGKFRLESSAGHSFYTYDRDSAGISNCVRNCARDWPPVLASENSKNMGSWTLIKRRDGHKQWAYEGKPIYGNSVENDENKTVNLPKDSPWHVLKE